MNILVDANSKAKLADLGCSRILERRNETMTIGIGTPLWMAPEIFTGMESKQEPSNSSFLPLCLGSIPQNFTELCKFHRPPTLSLPNMP